MKDSLRIIVDEARAAVPSGTDARRALTMTDLTSLGDADTPEIIAALCERAVTPVGRTAAVCVYDRFVPQCRKALDGSGVRVATVCNFPHGNPDPAAAAAEAEAQVAAGAHEVDVVIPYREYVRGNTEPTAALLTAVREACGDALLKVILETGELKTADRIAAASRDAIRFGADFIKTSTGKAPEGATLEAAAVMLDVIREMQPDTDRLLGFKPAGGIRTVHEAAAYLHIADTIMGEGWATPQTFRFGASSLLGNVLDFLGVQASGADKSGY